MQLAAGPPPHYAAPMRRFVAALLLAACGPTVGQPDDEGTSGAEDAPELWGFAASWPPADLRPVVTVALDFDDWCERTRKEQAAAGAVVSACQRVETLWCEGTAAGGGACYFEEATCKRWSAPGSCERRG